jgi:antitoxin component of MazEF toxin-antitoxin module
MGSEIHFEALCQVGDMVVVRIAPDLLSALDLAPGSGVAIEVEGGRLVLRPAQERRRLSLRELLQQCEGSADLPDGPIGREAL